MALTQAELKIIDQRSALQEKLRRLEEGQRGGPSAGMRVIEGQLRALDQKLAPPVKAKPPQIPKVAQRAVPPAAAPAAASPVGTVGVPELTQVPPSPALPTIDDAARDVAAQTPMALDPVADAMGKQVMKRKKYGVAATELTSPLGVTNLGNIGTKALLG